MDAGKSWEPGTIAQQLSHTVANQPSGAAIVADGVRLSWDDCLREAKRFAASLLSSGVQRGDPIGVWLPNCPEWLLVWMGASYIGASVVPINTRYKSGELDYLLRQSQLTVLFMMDEFLGIDYTEILSQTAPEVLEEVGSTDRVLNRGESDLPRFARYPSLTQIVQFGDPAPGATSSQEFLSAGDASGVDVEAASRLVAPDDPNIVVYTSGTTGEPKGAVHSHTILKSGRAIAARLECSADSRVLCHLPFFHVGGFLATYLPALVSGGCAVLMDHWDSERALTLIEAEEITVLNGIPTHFIDLISDPTLARRSTTSLDLGWIGGASIPTQVLDEAVSRLGFRRILPAYGMTETSAVTATSLVTDTEERLYSASMVAIPGAEVRTVDLESGRDCHPGQPGEIWVRGFLVMQGYFRKPEETEAVFEEGGWFRTGDIGILDENSYLTITGRKTAMFIVGGANVYPEEVEQCIVKHPSVRQVCVVGRPDERLGEVGVAWIVPEPSGSLTEDDIKQFCRNRLANYKVPSHIRIVKDLPTTALGKIRRAALEDAALREVCFRS